MRVTIDLMKKSTQIIDLSNVVNPRVGDDDLQLPLHIGYGDNLFDMRGKDVEFLSNDPNKKNIYIAGTCNTNTPGDNLYMGDLTFRFPAGTFKADGTYDPDKTMFRIVDKETQKVISSVNVKITVMKNNIEFDFDPDKTSYDSRLETMLHDFHDKGQSMLDEIKDLNNQAKSNVSGDTATTAKEAKKQADQNAGDISDLKGEVAGARGRFANMAGREDAQDAAINQKESIVNANANYAALQQKNAQQDSVLAQKAGKFELEDKLAQMSLEPEAFENETALKAKYPNGKSGIMVTVDTGHKWIWINGAWTDCGIFQSVGIADRSITSQQLQERASGLRVIQHDPWIIDFAKKTVFVSTQSYIYDDTLIEIPSQKYSVDSGQNITNLAFDPQTKEIIPYVNYYDIPVHSYYVGMIDFTQSKIFSSFQAVTPKQLLEDSRYPIFGNYNPKYISTGRNNLPAPNSFVVTYQEWSVAFQDNDAVVTVPYADYYFKDMILNIPSKGYQLSDLAGKKSVAYFLYLKIHMSDTPSAELKATTDMSSLKEQDIYIGWVDTGRKMYSLPHPQSAGVESSFKMIGQTGPITVDWDNSTLNLPYIDSVVGDLAGITYTASITPASLPLKATVGMNDNGNVYFVGLDISKPQWILTSNMSQISTGYLLGWIDKSTRRYVVAGYTSPNLELAGKQFSDKEIACLGDSITSGGNSGVNNKVIGKYTDYLPALTGAEITNAGYSGSHVAKQTGSTDSFVDRASAVKDQDVVLIFGGINDFCFNSPLGDASSTDVTTFYGALKSVIDTVLSNNAEAQLLLVTPYKTKQYGGTYSQDGSLRRNDAGATEEQYVNAIKEVGSYYSIPVLDLYNSGNFNASGKQSDLLTVDGLHPNDKGAQRLAKTIAHAINNL